MKELKDELLGDFENGGDFFDDGATDEMAGRQAIEKILADANVQCATNNIYIFNSP